MHVFSTFKWLSGQLYLVIDKLTTTLNPFIVRYKFTRPPIRPPPMNVLSGSMPWARQLVTSPSENIVHEREYFFGRRNDRLLYFCSQGRTSKTSYIVYDYSHWPKAQNEPHALHAFSTFPLKAFILNAICKTLSALASSCVVSDVGPLGITGKVTRRCGCACASPCCTSD